MIPRKLPSLNALRAFEAAARHLSLSRAAEELHVTPAAVGHQVKALEDYLGQALFLRRNRALALSQAGATLLPGLSAGFDQLLEAVEGLRRQRAGGPLTVSANVSFCSRWLIPRLERLRAAHPALDIRIDASNRLVDFAGDGVDLAIRYGRGSYPGLRSEKLWDTCVFPVCSPRLLQGEHPLREPADLGRHTLLHAEWHREQQLWPDWRMWLLSAGAGSVEAERGPQFNHSTLAIQAAIQGQGVALASSLLVTDELADGRLIKPFELSVAVDFGFFLVYPEAHATLPKVASFREWLLGEVARDEQRQIGGGAGAAACHPPPPPAAAG